MLSSLHVCGHCLPSCQAERQAPGLLVSGSNPLVPLFYWLFLCVCIAHSSFYPRPVHPGDPVYRGREVAMLPAASISVCPETAVCVSGHLTTGVTDGGPGMYVGEESNSSNNSVGSRSSSRSSSDSS